MQPLKHQSCGWYSVESWRVHVHVYLTFKNSPERNSPGLLILLRQVLFRGSHLLQILLKALHNSRCRREIALFLLKQESH